MTGRGCPEPLVQGKGLQHDTQHNERVPNSHSPKTHKKIEGVGGVIFISHSIFFQTVKIAGGREFVNE